MRKIILIIGMSALIGATTGCASATGMLYGDDRLAELTAPQFGLRAHEITISTANLPLQGPTMTPPCRRGRRCAVSTMET